MFIIFIHDVRSTAERLEMAIVRFCMPQNGRQEAWNITGTFKVVKLNINLFEQVSAVKKQADGLFDVTTNKAAYSANNVVIATGFYDIPVYLNVWGEDLPKVRHYYKEGHEFAFRKIIVVGANNSSVDAALECWRKGADVTMIIRKGEINDRVNTGLKPDVETVLPKASIKHIFIWKITESKKMQLIFLTPDA